MRAGVDEGLIVALVATIQLLFAALDGVERYRTRHTRYGGEALRPGTVAFLAATLLLFLAIQAGLIRLAPSADTLLGWSAGWLGRDGRPPLDGLGVAVVTVVAFYVGGLSDYLVHRFFNHSRTFWFTHEYHHLPTQVFVAMPGLAVRPFSVFTVVPTALVTVLCADAVAAALGAAAGDPRPLTLIATLNALILTTSHSSFLRQWRCPHRALRCLAITTPDEHLVHHTTDRPGNYGNLTTLWDRLLGTYRDPSLADNRDRPLGLDYDQDFLGTLCLGLWRLPASWRRRFQLGRYCRLTPQDEPRP